MARRKRLGETLLEANIISPDQLEEALKLQAEKSKLLGHVLVEMGWATEPEVCQAVSKILKVDYVNIENAPINVTVLKLVPQVFAEEHNILPLFIEGDKLLHLAMENPLEIEVIQQLEFKSGLQIKSLIAPPSQIRNAIRKYYHSAADASRPRKKATAEEPAPARPVKLESESATLETMVNFIKDAEKICRGNQIVKLVELMFLHSVKERVSDLHIEPFADYLTVRFKVDGLFAEELAIPKWLQLPVLSRIKVLAGMNIAESQKAQNGRTSLIYAKRKIDFRISTLPTTFGEKVMIRVLDPKQTFSHLEDLGLSAEYLEYFRMMIQQPRGWLVVTGPAGSGKTTTLYALLNATKHVAKRIFTIEDPIEYELNGVVQYQVNPMAGLTFASGLHSILRQRPNVILVGEFRDPETTALAMQASENGHFVLSTLPQKDVTATVEQLFTLGIAPARVASNLIGIVAQQLVRQICPQCKTEYVPDLAELRKIGIQQRPELAFVSYQGVGCETCKQTGYYGQIGIYELFVLNERLRAEIAKRPEKHALRRLAIEAGLKTMLQDGIEKIRRGLTTIAEVARVCEIEAAALEKITPCPGCGKMIAETDNICPFCQTHLYKTCQQCGAKLDEAWLLCPYCGARSASVPVVGLPTSQASQPPLPPQPPKRKTRIVVADDSKASRKILSFVIERRGHQVITAEDGDDALAKIRTERPDLVILDVMMPKRDGFAVCEEMRSREETRFIPVIMLTSQQTVAKKVNGQNLGADEYITKPFKLEELLARIEYRLRQTS